MRCGGGTGRAAETRSQRVEDLQTPVKRKGKAMAIIKRGGSLIASRRGHDIKSRIRKTGGDDVEEGRGRSSTYGGPRAAI